MMQGASLERSSFGLVDVALLGVASFWGLNMILVKEALAEFHPLSFNVARFVLATGLMWLALLIRRENIRVTVEEFRWLFVTGVVGNSLYQMLFIHGINASNAGNTAFMIATAPVWVAVLASVTGTEPLRARQWGGVFLSVSGAALVILGSGATVALSLGTWRGDVLTLLGAVCWGSYTWMTRPLLTRHSPLKVTTWAMTLGILPMVIMATPTLLTENWGAISSAGWLRMMYSGAMALCLGYIVWSWGIQSLGSTRTAIYNNVTPVVAGLLGAWWLGESWTLLRVIGAAIILFGVYNVRVVPRIKTTANYHKFGAGGRD